MTRHHFDPLSFVFGVVFAAVAALALTGPWELHDLDLAWIAPGLLVLLGLAVLLTARSRTADPQGPSATEEAAADEAIDGATLDGHGPDAGDD